MVQNIMSLPAGDSLLMMNWCGSAMRFVSVLPSGRTRGAGFAARRDQEAVHGLATLGAQVRGRHAAHCQARLAQHPAQVAGAVAVAAVRVEVEILLRIL